MKKRTDILEQKEQIEEWISQKQTKTFICQQLHCKPETLNSYLKQMGIQYEGRRDWNKGNTNNQYKTAEEYILSTNVKSSVLRKKIIKDGLKEEKCEICGLSEWQGEKIPLELHHIDGNHFNNDLENLQILCPNCHSIQKNDTFKNIGSYTNKCIDCGTNISLKATRCRSCANKINNLKNRIVKIRPSREELKDLIRNKSFVKIGEQYNVSDNAVRKWCDAYNLPRRVSDIKKYSDEEWSKI